MWKNLSFDGFGINGKDDHRTRIATFRNDAVAKEYGPLFAKAEETKAALHKCYDLLDKLMVNNQINASFGIELDVYVALTEARNVLMSKE